MEPLQGTLTPHGPGALKDNTLPATTRAARP
jgi:hypothetical protein